MANTNTTISIGWKIEDAAGGLKQVTMSAEDLRRIMRMNVVESEKLSSKFINLAAVCTSMDSLSSTFDSLKTVLDGLAGAQELATYLELKSSLQSLIPVMNDMLVQQNGLSSTGEQVAFPKTVASHILSGLWAGLSAVRR